MNFQDTKFTILIKLQDLIIPCVWKTLFCRVNPNAEWWSAASSLSDELSVNHIKKTE